MFTRGAALVAGIEPLSRRPQPVFVGRLPRERVDSFCERRVKALRASCACLVWPRRGGGVAAVLLLGWEERTPGAMAISPSNGFSFTRGAGRLSSACCRRASRESAANRRPVRPKQGDQPSTGWPSRPERTRRPLCLSLDTGRRSKTNQAGDHPDVRRLVGGCAAAVRRLQAATAPEPGDSAVGLGVDQVNRRFAAACAAAGLEGRRTSQGGRVGLAVELTARGAATHAVQLAAGWKDASMVVRYAASVATRDGAVSRYMR